MSSNKEFVLAIEPWRFRIIMLLFAVTILYQMRDDLQQIRTHTKQLAEVAVLQSDEYPTPEGLQDRIEWQRERQSDEEE